MLRTLKFERNLVGIGSGIDLEVILQPPPLAVKIKVDATIKIAIPDPLKLRNIGSPLGAIISQEVVAVAGQAFVAVGLRTRIRASELHLHQGGRRLTLPGSGAPVANRQDGFVCGEIKPVAAASSLKFHLWRRLALIRFKNKRQTTEHIGAGHGFRQSSRGGLGGEIVSQQEETAGS